MFLQFLMVMEAVFLLSFVFIYPYDFRLYLVMAFFYDFCQFCHPAVEISDPFLSPVWVYRNSYLLLSCAGKSQGLLVRITAFSNYQDLPLYHASIKIIFSRGF